MVTLKLQRYPKAFQSRYSEVLGQNDLENGENPLFRGLGVVLEGQSIDQKCQATNFT